MLKQAPKRNFAIIFTPRLSPLYVWHATSIELYDVKRAFFFFLQLMKYKKRVAPLILLAVSADFMPYEKYKHFQSENINLRDSNGKNLVHYAAQYHHPRIMTEAVMHGVPFDEEDNGGNLPLHFSCRSDDVESIECLSFLIEAGSSVTAKNKKGQSSLFFALQGRAVKCAGILLKAGASLRHSKLKTLKYEEVTLLADVEVILQAPKHKQIERVLQAGAVFSGCAKYDDEHRRELISLSESMQMTAVDMMEAREWTVSDISNDLFLYGLAKEQKVVSYSWQISRVLNVQLANALPLSRLCPLRI